MSGFAGTSVHGQVPLRAGVMVKVTRGPGPVEISIDECTDAELNSVAAKARRFGDDGWKIALELARWIREHPTYPPA